MRKRTETNNSLLIDRNDLAQRYGVSVRTISDWQASGKIPHIKLGNRFIRFPIQACDEIIMGKYTVNHKQASPA